MRVSRLSSARSEEPPEPDRLIAMGAALKTSNIQSSSKRDFLDLASLTPAELDGLLRLAARPKAELKSGIEHPFLRGKTLAMIFQKPSLRTRPTLETGMAQLGGHAIYLAPQVTAAPELTSVKGRAPDLPVWV